MPPNVDDPPLPSKGSGDLAPKPSISEPNEERAEAGGTKRSEPPANTSENGYKLRTFLSTMNSLAHILIGTVTGIALLYGFSNGVPLGPTPLHLVLCVIGYQLLMAEGILSLAANNGWSSHLRLVDKRRAHLILQILGSALAIAGSFIMILYKQQHWNTLHGKYALVALVFTSVSLVNGVASLYAYECRKFLPGNISKLGHICFGTVAFSTACVSLCYGFDKFGFRAWLGDHIAYTAIGCTAALSFIVILGPLASFYNKSRRLMR